MPQSDAADASDFRFGSFLTANRGASLASLQASPMGRPIYERMGFITPTEYRVLFGVV